MSDKNAERAVFMALLISITSSGCSKDPNVSGSIRELIREQRSGQIRLSNATRFEWDEVYLFAPYTPRSKVCDTLQIQVKYCERQVSFESKDDGEMSIAFVARGRLVHYAKHSRVNGDFTPVAVVAPLSPETAIFRVVHGSGDGDRQAVVKLVLK